MVVESLQSHRYPQVLLDDLARSGLDPTDMRVKPCGPAEKQATGMALGVDGYVIPYFSLTGKPLPFYRTKIYSSASDLHQSPGQSASGSSAATKYRQIADSPNHVYFPPRLHDLLSGAKYMVLTEGEKKAAACVKSGIPCAALGGVESWRSRNISLPKNTSIAQKPSGQISVRLPAGGKVEEGVSTIAVGLRELTDYCNHRHIPIILIFDSDPNQSGQPLKFEVQRAMATLAFELRHMGLAHRLVRYTTLPANPNEKVGLDDLLLQSDGLHKLTTILNDCLNARQAFPRYPNLKEFINKRLQKTYIGRPEQQSIAIAMLSDLDARGQRLRAEGDGNLYYFSNENKSLTKVQFSVKPDFAEMPFGRKIYQDYGVGYSDQRILGWLATQFSGEEPITNVNPEKLLCWRGDTLYYHINDGTVARVTKDGIRLIDNGDEGVIFEAGIVDNIPKADFLAALQKANKDANPRPEGWWYPVLKDTKIRDSERDYQRKLLTCLNYVSPFFYRWRGTQLPVEITTGEAGSGKSTLFELRLSILTGRPSLKNAPENLKDWAASITATGGMHVIDNVQMSDPQLRQRLSDEICRLITEPKPTIEQRKLYTNSEVVRIPVVCTMGITAIKMPFTNVDIIQRSIVTELDKGTDADLRYDAQWKEHQLQTKGGRLHWLAHHLVFVQRMLQRIDKLWDSRYQASYRLINLEQLLKFAAETMGWEGHWIPEYLENLRNLKATEADWTLEGLKAFAEYVRSTPRFNTSTQINVTHITDWVSNEDGFQACALLNNNRSLQRYLMTNKHTVATVCGIFPEENNPNNDTFNVQHLQTHHVDSDTDTDTDTNTY